MTASRWFDDLPVLAQLPATQAAAKLREIGDEKTAESIEATEQTTVGDKHSFGLRNSFNRADKFYLHTAHAFGFIPANSNTTGPIPIHHAGNLVPDSALTGARIQIALDRLRVAEYPGTGTHRILLDFYAQNQIGKDTEHLHFNATFRAQQGEEAAVLGYPLFVGLNVGTAGVAFKCFTVNVKNDEDEAALSFLESDVFRKGLALTKTLQPALGPLAEMAYHLTKRIASRHRNIPVQDFYLGLDFGPGPSGARLAEGSYLAVQVPMNQLIVWDWAHWQYNPTSGQVVSTATPTLILPYNYIMFRITRLRE
jgi:hypothetical protein